MTLAYYTRNFYLLFAVELISGLLLSLLLNHKVYRCYPWLQTDVRTGRELYKEYPEIGKYIKQLFFHKIGGFVQGQVLPILIYAFVSLPMVALYTNYTLITQRVQGLLDGDTQQYKRRCGQFDIRRQSRENMDKLPSTFFLKCLHPEFFRSVPHICFRLSYPYGWDKNTYCQIR